jgi:SAM-dependent methyltransferase
VSDETEYVLGTHDEEITRLGLQHRTWRAAMLSAWRRAGFTIGQSVVDVGCGPGYATFDLAELVGPNGCVHALDGSKRFLDVLEGARKRRGLTNINTYHVDLDHGEFPTVKADGAWCRWIFAFLQNPRAVVARLGEVVRPGGTIAIHEYFDYASWRAVPPCPGHAEFVRDVIASWRASGGEPDIALELPHWLEEAGFEVRSLRPIVEILEASDPMWLWLHTFADVGRRRLVDLGYLTEERAEVIWREFTEFETTPGARMITPGVLEIVAVRR